jgi:hypothetical protein
LSVIPHFIAKSVGKKTITDGFANRKCAQKNNNSSWKYTDEYILSVIVTYIVNIFQLSVKYQRTLSVCEGVGDCGISNKYFSNLGKMPTKFIRL